MKNKTKVAVFGGTGFIGSYLTDALFSSNFNIKMLVRSHLEYNVDNNIEIIQGDLSDKDKIEDTIKDTDVVIYAVGIIRENRKRGITFNKLHYEYFKDVVDISKDYNVKKIIYISANGVKPNGTKYQSTKFRAEGYLKDNFNNWLIFRPSVVYGDPKGKMEFMTQLKNDIIDKPIPAPLFFKYNPLKIDEFFKSNPIHIENLTDIIVNTIANDSTKNEILELGGLDEVNWKIILKTIAKATNKKKIFLPVPISFISIAAILLDRFQFFPITTTQIVMLKEGNTCNSDELFTKLNIKPIRFSADSIKYLN